MNINDPKTLAAELLQLSVYLEMANQCLHKLTAAAVAQAGFNTPDAGMVVVKAEDMPPADCWEGVQFREEGEQWTNPTWTSHPALRVAEIWGRILHLPHPQLNVASVSHLTIPAGRGEGEVGVDCRDDWTWSLSSPWAGPDPWAYWGWGDAYLVGHVGHEALAYPHDDDNLHQWWHPDESTTLDCAAVPHAMTWRAA